MVKEQAKFYQSVIGVALATELLLLIPLIAMQFTDEVVWSVSDFLIAGALLFFTGFSYKLITRFVSNLSFKLAVGVAVATTLLLIWANLAVGLIGSGPNAGNLMYAGVLVILVFSVARSNFIPERMEKAMYVTALSIGLLVLIAWVMDADNYQGSSVTELLSVNGFFAALYIIAGFLFRYAAKNHRPTHQLLNRIYSIR